MRKDAYCYNKNRSCYLKLHKQPDLFSPCFHLYLLLSPKNTVYGESLEKRKVCQSFPRKKLARDYRDTRSEQVKNIIGLQHIVTRTDIYKRYFKCALCAMTHCAIVRKKSKTVKCVWVSISRFHFCFTNKSSYPKPKACTRLLRAVKQHTTMMDLLMDLLPCDAVGRSIQKHVAWSIVLQPCTSTK